MTLLFALLVAEIIFPLQHDARAASVNKLFAIKIKVGVTSAKKRWIFISSKSHSSTSYDHHRNNET